MLPPPLWERVKNGEVDEPQGWNEYPTAQFPLQVARRLIGDLWETNGMPLICSWRGSLHTWTGTHWQAQIDETAIERRIWHRLEEVTTVDKDGNPTPWAPKVTKVNEVLHTIKVETHINDTVDAPAIVTPDGTGTPTDRPIIPMDNGVLDLTALELQPHTPALFNTWALPFEYNPQATCPRWSQFLDEVFAHDPNGARALQEFAGYLISGSTDLHKALLIVGPTSGGKGVISHMLTQLMGLANTAPTNFHDLNKDFGLSALIGKPLAIIEDAREDTEKRGTMPLERLLNIIANDSVSINRKNRDYWHGRLNTRVAIFTNNIPSFKDPSGAILRRFLMIHLRAQFLGDKKDPHLKDKLTKEMPGIINWAMDGLHRLEQQGNFTTPNTAETVHAVMSDMASPLKMWFDEQDGLEITGNPADCVEERRARESYNYWARSQERSQYARENFVTQLQATFPMVQFKNTTPPGGGKKARYLFGMKDNQPHFTPWTTRT